MKKWQKAFQQQYLLQIDEEPTDKNIKEFGLDLEYSELLKETDNCWVIYHNEGNPVINVVYKTNFPTDRFMESIEIA